MELSYEKNPTKTIKHIWCIHKIYILYHLLWIAKYISTLDTTLRTRTQLISIFAPIYCVRLLVLWTCSYATCACNIVHENMYMYISFTILLVCLFIWRRHHPHEGLLYSTATAQMSWDGSLSCHPWCNTKDSPYLVAFCDKQGILRTDIVTQIRTVLIHNQQLYSHSL